MEKLGTFILVCEVMHSLFQIFAAKIGAIVPLGEVMHSLVQMFDGKAREEPSSWCVRACTVLFKY
jgi:hypothetical protein